MGLGGGGGDGLSGALGSWGSPGRRHSGSHACAHSVKYSAHLPGAPVLLSLSKSMDRILCRLCSRDMHVKSAWVSLKIFPAFPGSSPEASCTWGWHERSFQNRRIQIHGLL